MDREDDPDEIDERLGDLWSMTNAESDRLGNIILAIVAGFVVVILICVLWTT